MSGKKYFYYEYVLIQIGKTNLYKIVRLKYDAASKTLIRTKTLYKNIQKPEAEDKLFRLERNLPI